MKILIIDENTDGAEVLASLLRRLRGHNVVLAANGLAGYQALERSIPDVALVDLTTPVMDGYALAKLVRVDHRYSSVRLIALTGDEPRERALAAGFDAHLRRPIWWEELAKLLDAYEGN